ncbi:hypothetical protein BC940DRAFT_303235 [Gongronella butleri]|nr:hypothetical protein BC940DRAFT_303235 [Gongronella butleri]
MTKHMSLAFMSEESKQELKELFDTFDKDKDHRISMAELRTTLANTGINDQQFQALASKIHTDANGYLSFDDFARLMRPTLRTPFRLTSRQKELYETFKVFDVDGDGVINAEELKSMMHKLGDRIGIEEAQQLIADVDNDHDGVVDFDEFCHMMGIASPRPSHDSQSRPSMGDSPRSPLSPTGNKRFSFRRLFHRKRNN